MGTRCYVEGFEAGFLTDLKNFEASLPTLSKKSSINLYAKPILASGWAGKVISDSRKISKLKNNDTRCKQVMTLNLEGPFTTLVCEQSGGCKNMHKIKDFVEFLGLIGFNLK